MGGILLGVNELYLMVRHKKNYINFVSIMRQNYLLILFLKIKEKVKVQKKLARLKKQKEEKLKKQEQQQAYRNQIMINNSIRNNLKKKEKEKADNEAYLEKLAKIKAERKKQVESKFIKAHN